MTLKLSPENQIIDVPDLNRFRIGDQVIAEECADCDRYEGIVVGIELQRRHASETLFPSITLLHDGYLTDGFKPEHLRAASPAPPVEGTADLHDMTLAFEDFLELRDTSLEPWEATDEERRGSAEALAEIVKVHLRSALTAIGARDE